MSRLRRLPPNVLLLTLMLAGCQSTVVPPTSVTTPGAGTSAANPNEARWAEVATALIVAGRSAEATIRVADRLEGGGKAKAKALHLLQADDEELSEEDDSETADGDDADGGSEDEEDFADFDDDVEEEIGTAELAELEEEEWEEWLDLEEGDKEWEQAIDVEDDDLAELTGDLAIEDLVDAQGKLKAMEFNFTPDDKAKAQGVPSHTVKAKVIEKGAEITLTSGANSYENVKWGSATFKLNYTKLDSGDREFTGTCQTDDGRSFNVTGKAYKDGTNDLTINAGTMMLAFRGVKEPVDAFGYILDKAPSDPQARALGHIQAHRNQPTTIQFYTEAVAYQDLLKMAPAPSLTKLAGLPDAGLGFMVKTSAPWQTFAADGRQERQAVWSVKPAGLMAHTIVVNEVSYPVTSTQANTIALVDQTTKSSLSFSMPQSLTSATLSDGRSRVEIAPNPDGSYLVNGRSAANAREAARLLVQEPVVQQASLENLSALDFALLNKELHATRGQVGSNCPPSTVAPRVPHSPGETSYQVLALGDTPAEAAMAPFTAVVQEAVALREGH